ncbi:Tat pathway signal protein [Paenibacillus sp. Mc5Re-14]|uniref:Tat pathway signal protein n=1 Tax=Paenibacillus sp. Mc5Re-14 TaxID=1030529 RepID=UPI000B181FED|nr:Tat pathway signal protein [Paenibacillus sp. Mc5Re-14]
MTLPQLPQSVIQMMASKEHRLWHYLWHGLRNTWEILTPEEQQSLLNVYPEWEPPRPALDTSRNPIRDNNSGEDFLYLHRTMIMMVNGILANEGNPNYPWIQGWKKVPRPWDNDYPVPPAYSLGGDTSADERLQRIKSDDFWQSFAIQEQRFTDLDYLRSVTLGQLGSDIEWTIHNWMHMRWSAESPMGYRPDGELGESVDEIWNQPAYNWLGDTYSAHVNPVFWKLHGWVDDRIDDWKRVNRAENYQWKGPGLVIRYHISLIITL